MILERSTAISAGWSYDANGPDRSAGENLLLLDQFGGLLWTLVILPVLLSQPFHKLLLQFLFSGQIELVFAGMNVGVFGKGNFDQGGVLPLAGHDADGVVFRFRPGECRTTITWSCLPIANAPSQ